MKGAVETDLIARSDPESGDGYDQAMLQLPDVMLCAFDTANVVVTVAALRRSSEHVRFGDTLLLTHRPVEGPFRTELIPELKCRRDYNEFVCQKLGGISTTRK